MFFFILTLPFKPHNFFYFLFILNNLKCYRSATWSSTNHLWTLITTEPYILETFVGCSGIGLCSFWWCFLKFLTHSTLGGCNYFNSIPFLTIFNVPNAPIKGVQIFFGHQKQQSPPLGSGLSWALKCSITNQFTLVLYSLLRVGMLGLPFHNFSLDFKIHATKGSFDSKNVEIFWANLS